MLAHAQPRPAGSAGTGPAALVLAQLRNGETFADQAAADLITPADKGYHGAGDHVLTPYRGRNKPAANPAAG
jgi:hypothetical protein